MRPHILIPSSFVALVTAGLFGASGCSTTTSSGGAPPPVQDGSEGGTGSGSSEADAAAGESELACTEGLASGFAKKPTTLTLPAARCGQSFDGVTGNGDLVYTMLDVNADRRADLVVTRDTCDEEIGVKRWDVYLASDTGFAKTPTAFALPAARCDAPFDAVGGMGNVSYTVLDVNADRRPDLVITSDTCDEDVGSKHWDVYLASDTGFAKTPTAFTLPAARCDSAFDRVSGMGNVRYSLLDFDADRRPDLVVTSDTCDEDVGSKHWDVYLASKDGAGFAKTPSPFTLPASRCEGAFDNLAGNGSVRYSLLDTNADRRPDLVVTADSCDEDVGTKRWDVYAASGTGFAKTPASFTLPAARCDSAFDAVGGIGEVKYTLLDLSCDGRGDLVVTGDTCDEEVGSKHWDVYVASDTGFAKTASPLTLPSARCGSQFDNLAKVGEVSYTLLDVSADSRGDIVVTADTCDEEIGTTHWEAYALE